MAPDPAGLVLHTPAFDAITECRGLAAREVAQRSCISAAHLSRLRNSTRGASEEAAGRLASTLAVAPEAFFPQLSGWTPPDERI